MVKNPFDRQIDEQDKKAMMDLLMFEDEQPKEEEKREEIEEDKQSEVQES
eukprot:CAMPEP_0202962106 /NCGR_PEP_ID=MMETSP1396-20130829/6213_1 /ASSEMBLY_ACC=CAM_ASM_000872 /TAXON_ID= /ORGANISM="Pseudokeronopsis sp., Strain Brazil" /LENGTH=49 /DNA_ID=CAMNT_0049682465 /DNA_START=640 /DNA_END=789 /DNA_ORIENTATION=+